MEIEISPRAQKDLDKWKKTGNAKVQKRITELTIAILHTPFEGIGKPEPLKHDFKGLWSRRITKEDRFIYEVRDQLVVVHSLKGHYKI